MSCHIVLKKHSATSVDLCSNTNYESVGTSLPTTDNISLIFNCLLLSSGGVTVHFGVFLWAVTSIFNNYKEAKKHLFWESLYSTKTHDGYAPLAVGPKDWTNFTKKKNVFELPDLASTLMCYLFLLLFYKTLRCLLPYWESDWPTLWYWLSFSCSLSNTYQTKARIVLLPQERSQKLNLLTAYHLITNRVLSLFY